MSENGHDGNGNGSALPTLTKAGLPVRPGNALVPGLRRLRDPRQRPGADARTRRAAGENGLHLRDRLRRALRLLHGHLRDARHPRPGAGAGDRDRDLARGPLGLGRQRRRRLALDRRQPPDPRPAPQRPDQAAALQQPDLRPDQGPVLADQREGQDHQVDPVRLRGPSLQPGWRWRSAPRPPSSPARSTSRRSTSPRPCAPPPSTRARPSSRSTRTATSSTTAPSTPSAARAARPTRSASSTASRSASAPRTSAASSAPPTAASRSPTSPRSARTALVVHDAHLEDPSHADGAGAARRSAQRADPDRRPARRQAAGLRRRAASRSWRGPRRRLARRRRRAAALGRHLDRLLAAVGKLKFQISVSLDGFVAGPNQSEEHPLGEGGEAAARVGLQARRLARAARPGGRRGQRQHRGLRGGAGQRRRDDHGPQHVRRRTRPLGRGPVGRLVGRRAALPHPGLRPHPPRARAA